MLHKNTAGALTEATTFVHLLCDRAFNQPDRSAYTFLLDGETHEAHLTYAELDLQARIIAARLHGSGAAGARVLLLYAPGLEYIAALFGCFYAGAVAVPVYPPDPARIERTLPRLAAIVQSARPAVALTTSSIRMLSEALAAQHPAFQAIEWIATDTLTADLAATWRQPALDAASLALLQYTSGSTSAPKGVMLTHANLLHNSALIHGCFEHTPASHGVIWLPPYHDMGLIGGILQPLYGGFPVTLMSPVDFLQRPLRWLQAITRYQATTSGGPNFAYDLSVRKIGPEDRADLDLSSWRVAFNGAEPLRPGTLDRFAEAFGACGFRRAAFYPCYGLAEATLIVSGGLAGAPPVTRRVDTDALQHNQARPLPDTRAEEGSTLVGCGQGLPGQALMIVDPQTLACCGPGQVGEIWVAGPSVAQGYWDQPAETEQCFHATLAENHADRYLRTGDLGCVLDDELFVIGRLKDLIIIRGRNYYPQDIELTVERCQPALRPGCGAAFSVEEDGEERLVVVQEAERQHRDVDVEAVAAAVRQAVAEQHELQVYAVALLKPGRLPKTSSGKIRRYACRAEFLAGTLDPIGVSVTPELATAAEAGLPSRETLLAAEPEERQSLLEQHLQSYVASLLQISPSTLDTERPLTALGLDSLAAIELQYCVESTFGVPMPMAHVLQAPSARQLAAQIAAELQVPAPARPALDAAQAAGGDAPLSYGQRAMWFLHCLSPESAAYNLASAVRMSAALDRAALQRALQQLVNRHSALRTRFITTEHGPVQRVEAQAQVSFQHADASSWTEEQLQQGLIAAAHQPLDPQTGPLLLVQLFTRSADEHVLLLVIHHIIGDFWSLALLVRELAALYQAEQSARAIALEPLPLQYTDYVRWQTRMVAGEQGDQLWAYWQRQLAGELPVLNLPTDRPRPPIQTYRGGSQTVCLSAELTRKLRALGQTCQATLYVTLLAAFQALLHRYSGQDELLIGSPTAGRSRAELAGIVGYFVNPLVLRADLSGDPTFATLVARARETVLAALEHQEYPFALLVERLQLMRDPSRSPLFQVMFIYQKSPTGSEEGLAAFAIGEAGRQVTIGGLTLESLRLEQQTAQFDLTLSAAEVDGELRAALAYNSDLFDDDTIGRMLGHFHTLLAAVAGHPQQRLADLPLLPESEQQQILADWNATGLEYPRHDTIHGQFEAQADRTPYATALVFEAIEVSFRELNELADRLARRLWALGAGPETLVGIAVERSPMLLVGLLGILKAGAAFVPLDPAYPPARLALMIADAGLSMVVTQRHLAPQLPPSDARLVCVDDDAAAQPPLETPCATASSNNAAYVIYTSGSTGQPKGVTISHRNVLNFFSAMDQAIGCTSTDTLLAVTSISFDISVLELFWTLTRGARVVLLSEQATTGMALQPAQRASDRGMQFSLFYFASAETEEATDKYRLLIEGAKFADQHEFAAVWTPERHFHAFGGLYPNPALTSAALAIATKHVQIRAGSVVVPLHDPIRVAEDWSMIDNLSHGRVGIAAASGWHANDFVFFPQHYATRKDVMLEHIETIKQLWQGKSITVSSGAGSQIEVRLFPRPIQPELPLWITAAGNPETFVQAGKIGARVLTHLLEQSIEEVGAKIRLYRQALVEHGHDPRIGHATLMLHTFVGEDREAVLERVREPFKNYLRTSIGLIANLAKSLSMPFDPTMLSPKDIDALLAIAFDRYATTSALFGTPESCNRMIDRLKEIEVDEIACLIDFGIDTDVTLAALHQLDRLRQLANRLTARQSYSLAAQAARYGATLLQGTPSLLQMLILDSQAAAALRPLRALLLGGEALPPAQAQQLQSMGVGALFNMYGPTETTIWSAVHPVGSVGRTVPIGRPIANTQLYILDARLRPVPIGVQGELYIGGDGVARGYLGRPELTAERFIPNPFLKDEGGRMKDEEGRFILHPSSFILYKTGDLARYRPDGTIEYLGRRDQQIKLRGHRIELDEIGAVLAGHPALREAVVLAREDTPGEKRLVAYVVPKIEDRGLKIEDSYSDAPDRLSSILYPLSSELRAFLKDRLPEYMLPSAFVMLDALPLTANGKLDRQALLALDTGPVDQSSAYVAPRDNVEVLVAAAWKQALRVERISIHDNFFDLGGHSLLIAQVHSQLQAALSVEFPLTKMLEYPTISALAKYLGQQSNEAPSFAQSQERARKQLAGRRGLMQRARPGLNHDD